MSKSRIVQRDLRWPMLAALLLASVALLYSPIRGFPFLQLDDNPRLLQQNLAQLSFGWAFNNPFAWQPLTWMSHQLDFRLFGFQNAGPHHLVNLILHLANTGLFFWLLTKLTHAPRPSLAAASLFALHPLRVESVAWVSGRGDLLAAFFALLALEMHRQGRWWALVALGALAMMASPAAAPFALLVFALDRFVLERKHDWRALAPLAAIGLVSLVLRATGGPNHETLLPALSPPSPVLRAYATLADALLSTLWPINLTIARPHESTGFTSIAGLLLLAVLLLLLRIATPWVRFGLLWFFATILPAMFLPSVWGPADHTLYLPHLGLMLALVFAVPEPWQSLAGKLASLPLLASLVLSWTHLHHFEGTIPLLLNATQIHPANHEAQLGLGLALAGQGTPAEAEKYLAAVAKARPDSALAWVHHGRALTAQKRFAEALTVLETARKQLPRSADVRFELGIAMQNNNRRPDAERLFVEALNLGLDARTGAIAYNNLGSYAADRREFPQAEKYFEQAFNLDLGFALAHRNYAMVLVAQDQRAKALRHLEQKALLWTGNNQMVGEYFAELMRQAYAEEAKKERALAEIEREVERKKRAGEPAQPAPR